VDLRERVDTMLGRHGDVRVDLPRAELNRQAVANGEALTSAGGALVTWTPPESTGRSPKDTVAVRRKESEGEIDWDSPNNLPIEASTFDLLVEDALAALSSKAKLYVTDRCVGADPRWAMEVKTVTTHAVHAAFTDNMFRPVPPAIGSSAFSGEPFTLLALPYDKLDPARYAGRLRVDPGTGRTSTMAVALDFDRRCGIVYGSAYCGSVKKLIFTAMNYYLPQKGVLPIHCSANAGPRGDTALLLGLSGTGKTTLSADPRRALLGDDEHGWGPDGIANFEGGCYAKLIDLSAEKEPEIHHAVTRVEPFPTHDTIVENTMMWPDGTFDFYDDRLTPNSRASYPLRYLSNIEEPPVGGHPATILFLTADANGVLPPVARLSREQAMLWFLMGYTSKLAGTETGIVDPKTVFSRFFGEPFMPRNPSVYAAMLGEKLERHGSAVYLINTGWSGGPFGEGRRMDIALTREMVHAALSGELAGAPCDEDPIFRVLVPRTCPGVADPAILTPRNTWRDQAAYERRARKLAGEFAAHFDKAYGGKGIDPAVAAQCPGR
jgi:phosphoenolpyruvate carboxykinase (ATP)